jgi:error-prone DNA polymerase
MIVGFSGFGFPKAHGAAFGLLAYQSTWLRVHHGPELLCSLLDEQPMGFYPPDALVHEAQRRGLTILPPDVNASAVDCTVESVGPGRDEGVVRIGLGYVRGVQQADAEVLVAARTAGGPFRELGELAARAGAGRPALELLAWAGACDALAGGDRRVALWRLGVATPGRRVPQGTQLALGLDLPGAPGLQRLGAWGELLADYDTTGLTARSHPLKQLRPTLPHAVAASRDLPRIAHGARVQVAGMVVARQRPGTASGVVFMLLEDEHGTVNLVVPAKLYERSRLTIRTEPLVLAAGRLERHPAAGGGINVLVERIEPLVAPDRVLAEVKELGPVDDFRAVAPAVMSFAQGRRR